MVKASHGLRHKGRNILRRNPRHRGLSAITHEFVQFEVGEQANIFLDPSIHFGAPHLRFHGKTGRVLAAQGRAYVLSVRDGNKYKTVISRPEHMRKVKY
ncbi:MAG TPA: 50S ribosomal protein L21e [Methanomassiliicoccales archaeon]|nr:MAG: 50S ribosomal protein L21e [Methanomassiliicoccus sp.]HUT27268.1 50S ribosomal protein L21e [Methanomassiliicoccales archaeon]